MEYAALVRRDGVASGKDGRMKPTDVLKSEHHAVSQMLAVLDKMAGRLTNGGSVPPQHIDETLDFLREFVDRCHHSKEEAALFPTMEQFGLPRRSGPIHLMLREHQIGRGLIRNMAEAAGSNPVGFARAARAYFGLLSAHIRKEESAVFWMADRALPVDAQAQLQREFDEIEAKVVGPGKHEHYHAMLHRLRAEYKV